MTFGSPWALLALAVLVPLVLAHLRRPQRHEVASTLLWRELGLPAYPRSHRIARPALPLLLLLQVLTVVLAVAALAEPAVRGPRTAPARTQIYVIDAGQAMNMTDVAPDRLSAARQILAGLIRRAPAGTRIQVIAATAQPRVLVPAAYGRGQALRALARLAPGRSPADMATALRLAALLEADAQGRVSVTVFAARGDPLPPVTDPGHVLTIDTIGRGAAPAQVPGSDCQPMPGCAEVAGVPVKHADVTIVGTGETTGELARAFGAMPGVTERLLTPAQYPGARGRSEGGLVVLDHWLPDGRIPQADAVLLVDPPVLPGGSVGGPLTDPVLSGTDDTGMLLAGVDLTSLSVPAAATRRIVPAQWMAPVMWSPSGPLLVAGSRGAQRAAVLAFDPARTNLPSLPAFPILLQNLLQWSAGKTSTLAVSPVTSQVVSFAAPAPAPGPAPLLPWWRWAAAGALLAVAAEAAYVLVVRARARGGVTTRLTAVALLAVAVTGPGLTRTGGGAPLLLVDRSGSIAGASLAAEQPWINAIRHANSVSFGTATDSDIATAIRLGDATATAGSASRLVLVSDGLATSGDALAAARASGVPVDVAHVAPAAPDPDAAVVRLQAPRAVRAGDTISLQVTVHATVTRPATVTIWRDGRALSRLTVRLAAGDNPLLISSPSGAAGWRRFRVTVAMAGDTDPRNNALDAVTSVTGLPRLMYIGGDGRFARLLRGLGFTVQVRQPSAVPATAGGFSGTDAVIIDDVPNGRLVPAQLTALSTAVRTSGRGLLVLGGTHSLTADWYAGTPLAAALPVAGTGSGPQASASLELVLDRSGSMNDLAGGATKIAMTKAAALGAIAFARARHDRLGIVSFDTAARVLVPMQVMTAASAAAADRAVAGLTADGGTDIYAALRAAAGQVTRLSGGATARQVVLMTDGVSQSASYDTLLGRLRAAGVLLTSVGLGGQVDKALLQHLAAAGGGRYYYTSNAADLPRIFAAEERRTVRPAHVTGRIPAAVSASVPAVRGLVSTRLSFVGGLDATRLKPLATTDITSGSVGGRRYPVLAQWQYGTGRVAVWTPGTSPAWAAGWVSKTGLWNDTVLWDDTVRWLLPGVTVPALRPRLLDAYPGGAPSVAVDTLGNAGVLLAAGSLRASVTPPRGSAVGVVLGPAGRGLYTGSLPDAGPGVYRVAVWPPGASGMPVVTELAVGYPREYLPSPAGPALLAQVAAASGGRVLTGPASAAAWESAHNGSHRAALWWLLTMLGLAAFLAGVAASPPPPGQRAGRPKTYSLPPTGPSWLIAEIAAPPQTTARYSLPPTA